MNPHWWKKYLLLSGGIFYVVGNISHGGDIVVVRGRAEEE